MIVNTSMTFLAKQTQINSKTTVMDGIVYAISLFTEIPSWIEFSPAFLSIIFTVLFIFAGIIPHIMSIKYYIPLFRWSEVVSFFYIVPLTFVLFTNCFGRFMLNFENEDFIDQASWLVGIACAYYLIFVFSFYISSNSLQRIDHIFICCSPLQTAIFIIYLIIDVTFAQFYVKKYHGTRAVFSLLFMIYIIIKPLYFSRLINAMTTMIVSYETFTSIAMMIDHSLYWKGFYCLLAAFIFSIFFNYIIRAFDLYHPKNVINLASEYYFCGKREKALIIIEGLQRNNTSRYDLYTALQLACELDATNFNKILINYSNIQMYLKDYFFIWHGISQACRNHGIIPPSHERKIMDLQESINELENEFWFHVWRSDSFLIPKLAAQLGRKKREFSFILVFDSDKHPAILESPLIDTKIRSYSKRHQKIGIIKSVLKHLSWFDLFWFVGFLLAVVLQIHLFFFSNKYKNVFESYVVFQNLTSDFFIFQFSLYDGMIDQPLLDNLMNSYHEFLALTDKKIFIDNETDLYLFTERFEAMISALGQNKTMFTKQIILLMEQLDIILKDNMINVSIGTVFRISYSLCCAFVLVAFIFCYSINIVKIWKSYLDYLEKFLSLPKSEVKRIGNFDTSVQFLEVDTKKPSMFSTLIDTLTYFVVVILIIFFYSVFVAFVENWIKTDVRALSLPINALSNFARIPLWFSFSVLQYVNKDPGYILSLNHLDVLNDGFCHVPYYEDYQNVIPDTLYSVVFSIYAGGDFDIDECEGLVYQISSNLYAKAHHFRGASSIFILRFISFFIFDFMLFLISLYLVHYIQMLMLWEQTEPKHLLDKYYMYLSTETPYFSRLHSNQIYFDDTNTHLQYTHYLQPSYKKQNVQRNTIFYAKIDDFKPIKLSSVNSQILTLDGNHYEELDIEPSEDNEIAETSKSNKIDLLGVPLVIFLMNTEFIVKYATVAAGDEFNIIKGKKINELPIDTAIVASLIEEVERFKDTASLVPHYIPITDKQSFIVVPRYGYDLKLSQVAVALVPDVSNEYKAISTKYNAIFHQICPKFVPSDAHFPFHYDPILKSFILIVFRMSNFNEWADSEELAVVQEFIIKRQQELDKIDNEYFCRIREWTDTLIYGLDRQQTKLSIWKILDVATEFINSMIITIENFHKKFDIFFPVSCLIYKCKEPSWYCGVGNNVYTDLVSDVITTSTELDILLDINAIKYATQRKEMKVPNTAKLRTCYRSDGNPVEMFLIV